MSDRALSDRPASLARYRATRLGADKWFTQQDPDAAADKLAGMIASWQTFDRQRLKDLGDFSNLYGTAFLGFTGTLQDRTLSTRGTRVRNMDAATFNGIRMIVDTLANIVCEQKPVAQYAANGGNWTAHKVAKTRNQFTAGWFYEQQIYFWSQIAFIDSGVWGQGVGHVYLNKGRPAYRRTFPGNLFISPGASITSQEPNEIAHIELRDRYELWCEHEGDKDAQAVIEEADPAKITIDGHQYDGDDLVQVNSIWRLPAEPTTEGDTDGRVLHAIGKRCLAHRPYRWQNFPFPMIWCAHPQFGFFADQMGIAAQFENLQAQYNDLSQRINVAMSTMGGGKLWLPQDANVVSETLTDETGEVIRSSKPPQSLMYQVIQPELIQYRAECRQQFYDESGISQLAAQAEKGDDQESGIALQKRISIFDTRHSKWMKSYEDFHIDVARCHIQASMDAEEMAKELRKDDKEAAPWVYEILATKGDRAEAIKFSDLGFKADEQYVITCLPVSDLPDSIEGRLDLAQKFVQMGWYDEATARQVFQTADTQRVETLFNANRELCEKILDAIIESGKEPPAPDATADDLPMWHAMAQQQLQYAREREVPQARIDQIIDYVNDLASAMQANIMANAQFQQRLAAMNPQPQPAGGPQAAPMQQAA